MWHFDVSTPYNISFIQWTKMAVLVEIITTKMVKLETHFQRITMLIKTTFIKSFLTLIQIVAKSLIQFYVAHFGPFRLRACRTLGIRSVEPCCVTMTIIEFWSLESARQWLNNFDVTWNFSELTTRWILVTEKCAGFWVLFFCRSHKVEFPFSTSQWFIFIAILWRKNPKETIIIELGRVRLPYI